MEGISDLGSAMLFFMCCDPVHQRERSNTRSQIKLKEQPKIGRTPKRVHSPRGVLGTFLENPLLRIPSVGHTPSTAGTFRKKFRKDSGKTPETLSERFLEFPSRVRLGCPKSYNSRHLRLPEHFQNCLPPSTAGGASFFRSGSGEGLPEPVMEFPAVLGVFLILRTLLRTLLRTVKPLAGPPSQNPFENPSPEPFPKLSQNPSWNAVLPYDPLGMRPTKSIQRTANIQKLCFQIKDF